eukprot:CAMPEP_0197260010 /NCGR_PEP_ID=MMETSP1429-20130617/83810_1 /TAXON_ID=49237 /ORGANISM="Chaetoceros  sp., Strain UNC1202" /LENGTH=454 /DNA_ID=CAMNT_0042724237 /DNA_START=1253 /DNA_END=2618 /DNA_ORIENTATION=-
MSFIFFLAELNQKDNRIQDLEVQLAAEKDDNRYLDDTHELSTSGHSSLSGGVSHEEHDMQSILEENKRLVAKVHGLENTINTQSVLLQETIASVNLHKQEGATPRRRFKNASKYLDEDVKQLENICRVHQTTIMRHTSKIEELQEHLKESNDKVSGLSLRLEARELEIKSLETEIATRRSCSGCSSASSRVECGSFEWLPNSEDGDTENVDTLKLELTKRNAIMKEMKARMKNLEQNQRMTDPRNAVLNLRKVSLLQEMQDATIRRLDILTQRLQFEKNVEDLGSMIPAETLVISMSDNLALLHDYHKISLHLLESRLTNEIESLKSSEKSVEMDESVMARFDRTIEMLRESENEMKLELNQHRTKILAKDNVIQELLERDHERVKATETLRSELEVLKDLAKYCNVDNGIMVRIYQCSVLEKELQIKERVIERLNVVIDEYRHSAAVAVGIDY